MSGNSSDPITLGECGHAPAIPHTTATDEPVPPASVLEAAAEQEEVELDDADEKAAVLQALVESAPDLVIHVDRQGRIRFINRLAQGFRREDVIGTEWLAYVGADQHGALTAALQKTLATGQTTEVEVLGPGDKGGPTWYWTRIAAVLRRGRVSGAVLLARDITEKKFCAKSRASAWAAPMNGPKRGSSSPSEWRHSECWLRASPTSSTIPWCP